MIKHLKSLASFLLVLVVCFSSSGQLTIQPMVPQAGLLQKTQLWNISAIYVADDNPLVDIEITLTDRITGTPFLTASSANITLSRGMHYLTESSVGPVLYEFQNGTDPGLLLPVGHYNAHYKVRAIIKDLLLADEYLPVDAEAISPPLLNLPSDSAELETQYPQFAWLPPTPVSIFTNLQYDLIVTEILPRQSPQEAIERNLPLYSVSGLTQNMMVYPSSNPMPDTGKYYAWQIMARNGDSYGAKSEVWTFKIITPLPVLPKKKPGIFYPKLTKQIYDAVYTAGSPVRFEFINERNEPSGELKIYKLENGKKVLMDKKNLTLSPGQNFISWATDLPKSKDKNQTFIVVLSLPSREEWGCLLRANIKK